MNIRPPDDDKPNPDDFGAGADDPSPVNKLAELRKLAGQAAEDYLKVIYEIAGIDGRAMTSQIAEKLNIRPASVTGMVQKLATLETPLVVYNKHRGVGLTPEGEKIAIEIIRHHRLLELFLHDTLGYRWDEVHREADLLEHFISEQFEARIAAVLGNPEIDPHGDPIPTQDLAFPDNPHEIHSLHSLRPTQTAIVQRVSSANTNLLRDLAALRLTPGVLVEVVDYLPFEDIHQVKISSQGVDGENKILALGSDITKHVHVYLVS